MAQCLECDGKGARRIPSTPCSLFGGNPSRGKGYREKLQESGDGRRHSSLNQSPRNGKDTVQVSASSAS